MNTRHQLILFAIFYLVFVAAFYWARSFGGWLWLLPWGLVVGLIGVFYQAERRTHRATALSAYRFGFWAIVLILLGIEWARALGMAIGEPPALWAIPPAVWLVYYATRVWGGDTAENGRPDPTEGL